jgi:hypothetical protein
LALFVLIALWSFNRILVPSGTMYVLFTGAATLSAAGWAAAAGCGWAGAGAGAGAGTGSDCGNAGGDAGSWAATGTQAPANRPTATAAATKPFILDLGKLDPTLVRTTTSATGLISDRRNARSQG